MLPPTSANGATGHILSPLASSSLVIMTMITLRMRMMVKFIIDDDDAEKDDAVLPTLKAL